MAQWTGSEARFHGTKPPIPFHSLESHTSAPAGGGRIIAVLRPRKRNSTSRPSTGSIFGHLIENKPGFIARIALDLSRLRELDIPL